MAKKWFDYKIENFYLMNDAWDKISREMIDLLRIFMTAESHKR